MENEFTKRLKIKVPLIVAPMAGGPSSVEFVSASAEAGALGSIGTAYINGKAVEDFTHQVRLKTKNPISINLFIPSQSHEVSQSEMSQALVATETYRRELGLPQLVLKTPYEENFDEQFESVLKVKPEVFSFVFGLLKSDYVKAMKKADIYTVGTATTLEEALALQESGVDAMTLQGIEAGGHRGIFDPEAQDAEISAFDLLDLCKSKIKIPMFAAGGIMTREQVKQALSKGAGAVQMGTAFLNCIEAGTSAPYRKALTSSSKRKTKTTRVFSGRLARGMENRFMLEMEKASKYILPFPAQNKFTRDLRGVSLKNDSPDFLSLWSGTGEGDLFDGSVADLIQKVMV